jgi:hypothetical protein
METLLSDKREHAAQRRVDHRHNETEYVMEPNHTSGPRHLGKQIYVG